MRHLSSFVRGGRGGRVVVELGAEGEKQRLVVGELHAVRAAGDLDAAKEAATLAASLTRKPFLPGEDGIWVEARRRELADVRRRALDALADACLRSGDGVEAAKWAGQTIVLEPFRETGYRRLMEAHAAAGNRAEALRVYERCRRLLAEELGTYPSPETESVYRLLLGSPAAVGVLEAGEPSASPPAVGEQPRVPARRRTRVAGAAVTAFAVCAAVVGVVLARPGGTHSTVLAADAVGFVDAGGARLREQFPVGAAPTSAAVGDGAVWVVSAAADAVERIGLDGTTRQTIAVGDSPSGIAVGGGGVWVANHDDDTVSWISPQSDAVVRTIHVGSGPTAVASGFGSIWVTNADDRTVTRIDARSGAVATTIRTNAVGSGIATGGGSVWVTDEATRTVFGIDPATNAVVSNATVGAGPTGIAYGAGSLWVANSLDDTVSRIDATTLATQAAFPVAGGPSAVAFGGGSAWVSAEFDSRVVRIDPRRGVVAGSTPLGSRPESLAAVGDGVWVAAQASGAGHRGGRLVAIVDGLDTIDPALLDLPQSEVALGTAYDGLTGFRRAGGAAGTQLVPDLADALPLPTANGTSYTFRLRPGIRYSNGQPLRAVDFRRALARELELNHVNAPSFADLAGAAACSRRRHCDLSRSVVVDGRSTITFRLRRPDPRLFYELSSIFPVPAGTPLHDVGTKPVPSTGPYAIGSYSPHRLLVLVRNRYFHSWSAAARPDGYPDEIVLRLLAAGKPAVSDVLHGKADLLFEGGNLGLRGAPLEDIASRDPRRLHLVPQQATDFIFLNVRRPPFDDVRVRRALNYAIDRRRVATLHDAETAAPTCQLVPPTLPGYRPYCPYTIAPDGSGTWRAPDLAKARALIRASGTRGEPVVVWSFSYFRRESQYVVALLRRLGYRARLHYIRDIDAYFAALNEHPGAQAGLVGWYGVSLPSDLFATLACGSSPAENWSHFCDPRIDARVARLAQDEAADPAGTAAEAEAIDRRLTLDAPWVPLFTPREPDLTSARVGDYQAANGAVLVDQLWVR